MKPVAVIGAGLLGRGIAAVAARSGFPVILHDSNPTALAAALEFVRVESGSSGDQVVAEASLARAVDGVEFVIESVIEDLLVKRQVFFQLGEVNADAILMSNSSVLPISQIAVLTRRPERAVGTHWWNPPGLIPVVEVICGQKTSDGVVQRTIDFLEALGKTPVRVERDVPGFVGNRLQHALWREALALVSKAECSAEDVDRIASASLGASLAERGPIAEMHALGLPRVVQELKAILPLINSDPHPAPLLRDKVAENQLGAKTGQGFLAWPAGQRERATVRLRSHLLRRLGGLQTASGSTSLSDGDWKIARRLRAAVWREALGMLENNVCSPETIDVMATKTLGLRLAVMGPVENADYVGLDLALAIHEALLPCLDVALGVPMKLKRAVEMGEPL
jgi:3-hydroxybutyryl-CoA dehydrogenase